MRERNVSHWGAIVLPVVLVGVSYAGGLFNGFVWDDRLQIVENPHLERIAELPGYFTHFSQSLNFPSTQLTYRPMLLLSLFMDHQLWGVKPFGYHLTNLLLHLANVLLVILLARALTGSPAVGLLAGTLFGLHPVQTEVVDWVSGRTDAIAALFILLTALGYRRWIQSSDWRTVAWGGATLLAIGCALLSKETAVAIPLVLLLLEGIERGGFHRAAAWRVGLATLPVAVYLLVRLATLSTLGQSAAHVGWGSFVATSGAAIAAYLRLIVWPVPLTVIHDLQPIAATTARLLGVIAGSVAAVTIIWMVYRKWPVAGFGLAWAAGFLLPSLALILASQGYLIAERNLYVPMAGAVLAAGWLVWQLMGAVRARWGSSGRLAGVATLLLLTADMAWATSSRHPVWRSDVSLWTATVTVAPGSSWAHLNLGIAHSQAGRVDDAVKEIRHAIMIDPRYGKAHYNLGRAYEKLGRVHDAMVAYRQAIAEAPAYLEPYRALANLYIDRQAWRDAAGILERLLTIDPTLIEARLNLAVSYQEIGAVDRAIPLYEDVLTDPTVPVATYYNLGLAFEQAGRFQEAVNAYERFLAFSPPAMSSLRQRVEQRMAAIRAQ